VSACGATVIIGALAAIKAFVVSTNDVEVEVVVVTVETVL